MHPHTHLRKHTEHSASTCITDCYDEKRHTIVDIVVTKRCLAFSDFLNRSKNHHQQNKFRSIPIGGENGTICIILFSSERIQKTGGFSAPNTRRRRRPRRSHSCPRWDTRRNATVRCGFARARRRSRRLGSNARKTRLPFEIVTEARAVRGGGCSPPLAMIFHRRNGRSSLAGNSRKCPFLCTRFHP